MDTIEIKARAKINIALGVNGKLENGYHDLSMIMQTVNLHDTLLVKKTAEKGVHLTTNRPWLPTDERNLVYRTCAYLMDRFGLPGGVSVNLNKRIPVSAGLGGGSADCAATLVALKRLFSLPLTVTELMQVGKTFGADVPFCVLQGTALAEGIGDILTPLPSLPFCHILIVKPYVSVSTADIFSRIDMSALPPQPSISNVVSHIENGNLQHIAKSMFNTLEAITIPMHPIISAIKNALTEAGALGTLMSGSGSAVFGLFPSYQHAKSAKTMLKQQFKIRETFITTCYQKASPVQP